MGIKIHIRMGMHTWRGGGGGAGEPVHTPCIHEGRGPKVRTYMAPLGVYPLRANSRWGPNRPDWAGLS